MTALRGEGALESGLVRIRGAGEVVGAGFLVAADVICTCAHVIADALGLPRDTEAAPAEAVQVEFPLVRDADGAVPAVPARVVSWQPVQEDDSGDVALLRLDAPVSNARPVPLVDGTSVWGHSFRAYGFPGGGDHGVWATGTLRSLQGAGWVQMDTGPGGPPVTKGYSGAAVWDDVQGGVVGLAVAAGRGELAGTAFLVPSAALVDEEVLRPACPFRGLEAFEEEDAAFFHGRDDDIGRLAASIAGRRLTLVVGPSGSGKSSLIRAGVLPRLRADGMSVTALRPVPGVRPETLLAHALVPVLEPETGEVDRLSRAGELARLLAGDADGRAGAAAEAGEGAGADSGPTSQAVAGLRASLEERADPGGHLIVVDQLEEYAGAEPAAARTLLRLLLALADHPRGDGRRGLRVVATARQESLDVLLTSETSGALSDAVLFLAPLDAENLYRAITGPVDAVPGLWLEPGLAERIVEEAADQPGRMPLVEFTLTRLWERRERSMLTHAAYDELGGVAGTLVGYADDAYRAHVPASEEAVARRLFVQLARPDDRGGYTRRATAAAQLDPAAVSLARRLARGKLVVIGRTAEGTEIVDLTHEALTRLWPRLRGWLDDSRNFRVWQEQLRTDMARWEAKGKETGALQRGKTLAEGVEWLQRRPEDVPADERSYIEAGRRYAQRTIRGLLAAAAVLVALLLLVGTLGAITLDTSQELRTQLRTLASRALAEESGSREAQEPGTAVQLALAAWHAGKTPQAREALLRQYVRAQYVRGAHTGLWRGRVQDLDATPDGRTLVVLSKPDGGDPYEVSVVTGALDGTPRHYTLQGVPETDQRGEISSDGRHYAVAMPNGTVRMWRLDGKGGKPAMLGAQLTGELDKVGAWLDFSADGSRLLRHLDIHTPGDKGAKPRVFLDAWDLRSLKPLPVADTVVSTSGNQSVNFGEDPGTVVVSTASSPDASTPSRSELRDLRTGRVLRKLPADDPDTSKWDFFDVTGTYGYETADFGAYGYAEVALGRRDADDAYVTRLPLDDEPGYDDPKFAVAPSAEGGLTVLSPVGNTLIVAHASAAPRPDAGSEARMSVLSPDGRRVARLTDREVQLVDLERGGTTTAALPRSNGTWGVVWTPDSKRLVLWDSGPRLFVYEADGLAGRLDVPLDTGGETGEPAGMIDAVEPLASGDVAVLTGGGVLLRVDPDRGVQTGEPLRVDSELVVQTFPPVLGQLRGRPGNPHQVAVVTRNDTGRGKIQIWDIRVRRQTETLDGDEISTRFDADDPGKLAFSPDGQYLMVQHNDARLHRWDIAKREITSAPITMETADGVTGVTGSGLVVTAEPDGTYEVWSADEGARIGTIPSQIYSTAVLRGTRLIVESHGRRTAFDLRPDTWFTHLCETLGRGFTAEEREGLPDGTPPEAPCTRDADVIRGAR
ncbi:trypsin-like peptidase domain-containing protein [Streptomyces sp. NPDC059909]|uniref:nSTAND1 domain-containing NTPase n=1 Tax=Streptomyces sp. NPDC059909 TaxID=3346998 RepID=UPI003661311C